MADHRHYRPLPLPAAAAWQPLSADATASVAGLGGTLIATISRRCEPDATPTGGGALMSVVIVDGDIDLDSAPLLERALMPAVADQACTCLDMRRTGFFGAAGVHVLVAAHQRAVSLGHRVVLRGAHGIAAQVLAVAGIDRLIAAVD